MLQENIDSAHEAQGIVLVAASKDSHTEHFIRCSIDRLWLVTRTVQNDEVRRTSAAQETVNDE